MRLSRTDPSARAHALGECSDVNTLGMRPARMRERTPRPERHRRVRTPHSGSGVKGAAGRSPFPDARVELLDLALLRLPRGDLAWSCIADDGDAAAARVGDGESGGVGHGPKRGDSQRT